MTTKKTSTLSELEAFRKANPDYVHNKTLIDQAFEIIKKGLPKPKTFICEYTNCNRHADKFQYNLAGEILHIYCNIHWKIIMKHLRFFQ